MAENFDIIVVGAGFSGLCAARNLLNISPNLRVAILEATSRVGGRVESLNGLVPWPIEVPSIISARIATYWPWLKLYYFYFFI